MKSTMLFFKEMTVGKSILLSLSPVLIMILSMKTILFALFIIIIIDLLTGIRKSHYTEGVLFQPFKKEFWKVIKSKELRRTWTKAVEYITGIIAFTILDTMVLGSSSIQMLGNDYSIAELAVTVACLVEVYSVYENMEAVSGNNLFKKILGFLPRAFKSAFAPRRRRGQDEK